jgi:hypothetical protein
VRDVGYGLRMLNRNRGFAATAIASIGIGVTAAIFSFADALLLRPLPVPRPGQLYVKPRAFLAWPRTWTKGISRRWRRP